KGLRITTEKSGRTGYLWVDSGEVRQQTGRTGTSTQGTTARTRLSGNPSASQGRQSVKPGSTTKPIGNMGRTELFRAERAQCDNACRQLLRLIGECKKAGEGFDDLLLAMESVSSRLRQIDDELQALELPTADDADSQQTTADCGAQTPQAAISFSITRADGPEWAARWNADVDRHPNASIYHRHELANVIRTALH